MAVDFSKLDARGLSEELHFLQLNDQFTGAPIEDEDGPAGFMIRGSISRTAQKNLSKMFANAKKKSIQTKKRQEAIEAAEQVTDDNPDAKAIRAKAEALSSVDEDQLGFESAHQSAIDEAMCYIHSAVNFSWGEEGPVGDNPVLIRKVLDSSFPILQPDDKGELRAVNTTYAKQVTEAAEEYGRFLGNQPNS